MSCLPSILSSLDSSEISNCCLQNGSVANSKVQHSQVQHRLDILKSWLEINKENKSDDFDLETILISGTSLDVGCGQGDFLATVASLLLALGEGNESKVVGIDPARLDYGSPFTLRQAQDHLSSSKLSSKLSFEQSTLEDYLKANPKPLDGSYSTLFLVHSIYYLSSPTLLISILTSARQNGIKSLCLSEWALKSSLTDQSEGTAIPHILSVLLQSISPLRDGNVQFAFTPQLIIECATKAGWDLIGEKVITPRKELNDGGWEIYSAREVVKNALKVDEGSQDDDESKLKLKESIRAHSYALEASIPEGKVGNVRSMDVWCGVFRPSST